MPDPNNDAPILSNNAPTQPVAPDVSDPNVTAPTLPTGPAQTAPPTPQGVAPGAPIPKQTFAEGANRALNGRQYGQNSAGDIVSADPVRAPSAGGILGNLLFGALRGISEGIASQPEPGARGRGAGMSAAAAASQKANQVQDDRNRQIAQKNAENERAATEAKLRANLLVAQTHDLVQKSALELENHKAELHSRGIEDEEHQIQIANGLDQRRQIHADLNQTLISHGLNPYASVSQSSADGKSLDAQAIPHAPALAAGKALPVATGGVDSANGANLFSYDELDQPVTGNSNDTSTWIKVPYFDGTKDNAGNFVEKSRLIKPDGKIRYSDVARQFMAADKQLDDYMKKDASQMAVQQKKLEMKEANERILLTDQQLQNAKTESVLKQMDIAAKKQDKSVQDAFEDSASHNPTDVDGTQTAAYMQQNHPKEYARLKANAIIQKANEGTTQVTEDALGNKTTTKSVNSPFLQAPPAIEYTDGATTFHIPPAQEQAFLKVHPNAQKGGVVPSRVIADKSDALSIANPNQIVVQGVNGPQIMPDIETAKNFVTSHPGYQILGAGTKQETQFGTR